MQTLPYFCTTADLCEVLPSQFTKPRLQTCPISGRNLPLKDGSQDQKHQLVYLHLVRPRDERQKQKRRNTVQREQPLDSDPTPASSLTRFLTGLGVGDVGSLWSFHLCAGPHFHCLENEEIFLQSWKFIILKREIFCYGCWASYFNCLTSSILTFKMDLVKPTPKVLACVWSTALTYSRHLINSKQLGRCLIAVQTIFFLLEP